MRVGGGIRRAAPEREAALLRLFKGMEAHLIEARRIQAVAFRFVGTPLAGSAASPRG